MASGVSSRPNTSCGKHRWAGKPNLLVSFTFLIELLFMNSFHLVGVKSSSPALLPSGSGPSWNFKISDQKVCGGTESHLPPHIAFHCLFQPWGNSTPLCSAPGEAYHFTPTCRRRPAHGAQNKCLSVCSSVEVCPMCAWPDRGFVMLWQG